MNLIWNSQELKWNNLYDYDQNKLIIQEKFSTEAKMKYTHRNRLCLIICLTVSNVTGCCCNRRHFTRFMYRSRWKMKEIIFKYAKYEWWAEARCTVYYVCCISSIFSFFRRAHRMLFPLFPCREWVLLLLLLLLLFFSLFVSVVMCNVLQFPQQLKYRFYVADS